MASDGAPRRFPGTEHMTPPLPAEAQPGVRLVDAVYAGEEWFETQRIDRSELALDQFETRDATLGAAGENEWQPEPFASPEEVGGVSLESGILGHWRRLTSRPAPGDDGWRPGPAPARRNFPGTRSRLPASSQEDFDQVRRQHESTGREGPSYLAAAPASERRVHPELARVANARLARTRRERQ